MKTWKEAVISQVADWLHSSNYQIEIESANHPDAFTNVNQSLQKASQNLMFLIRNDREAERLFFKQHPELNP